MTCLLAGAACGSEPPEAPAGSETVTIPTPDGEVLEATVVGSGTFGVVVVHGANANRSNWYGAGAQIAAAGYRVLLVDLRGTGSSTGERRTDQDVDILAAAGWLEEQGIERVALIGSSMGGTSVLVAAAQRPVAGVIALSPPQVSFAMDATAAAPKIAAPVMLLAAEGDTTYADSTRALAGLLGVEAVIVAGDGHGTGMFADNPDVVPRMIAFLDGLVSG